MGTSYRKPRAVVSLASSEKFCKIALKLLHFLQVVTP